MQIFLCLAYLFIFFTETFFYTRFQLRSFEMHLINANALVEQDFSLKNYFMTL